MNKYEDISIEINEYIATITIQRPPNNFFDSFLIQQIADAYEELDGVDDCRVILLCSEGKNFCAGANFGEDKDMHDKAHPYSKLYEQAVRLFRTKKPVIAVVQGAAVGGGLGLALSADFRINNSSVYLPFSSSMFPSNIVFHSTLFVNSRHCLTYPTKSLENNW